MSESRLFEVEFRLPGDNSWCLKAQRQVRERMGDVTRLELLPAVEARVGSGWGELSLRWIEIRADGAWAATLVAAEVGVVLLPELERFAEVHIDAVIQDPDGDRRRPTG